MATQVIVSKEPERTPLLSADNSDDDDEEQGVGKKAKANYILRTAAVAFVVMSAAVLFMAAVVYPASEAAAATAAAAAAPSIFTRTRRAFLGEGACDVGQCSGHGERVGGKGHLNLLGVISFCSFIWGGE